MTVSRKRLVEIHLILGSFLLPVTLMFAITGSHETKTETLAISNALSPGQFEWSGSAMDFVLEPTANPLEMKASFKHATPHRYFVQLHKAKGGLPFKLLAVTLGIGLILLLLSGWFIAQASPQMRRIRFFATLSGIAAFLAAAGLS